MFKQKKVVLRQFMFCCVILILSFLQKHKDTKAQTCNHTVSSNEELIDANNAVSPGEIVCLENGTYNVGIGPFRSGADGLYITYQAAQGANPVITERSYLDDKSYLIIKGIRLESDGHTWVSTSASSHHIQLLECEFDSSEAGSYSGIYINGSQYITIGGSTFGKWMFGNAISGMGGSHILIEDNDFSQAIAEHGLANISASDLIIRNNYFRNPCDRALSLREKTSTAENLLVENNVFMDTNWNRKDSCYGEEPGSEQALKFNVSKGIFRNNLVINTNEGKNYDYGGSLHFSTYEEVLKYEYNRVYHNTFYKNKLHAITFIRNTDTWDTRNNKITNNVIAEHNLINDFTNIDCSTPDECKTYSVYIGRSGLNWQTYLFDFNVISDSQKDNVIYIADGGKEQTVEEAQINHPDQFQNNIIQLPQFQNENIMYDANQYPENYSLENIDDFFAGFVLTSDSSGKYAATHLAEITASSTGTTIRIDDALYFTDGMGMINGDRIIIDSDNQVAVQIINVDYENNILEVDQAISVLVGDRIYLEAAGTSPDIGVYGREGSLFPTPIPSVEGDLNGDGVVDIFDLVIIGSCFGQEAVGDCARADANGNGVVDIFDLVMVGGNFGSP
ncbi:hypothetical protein KKB83_05490 [Patescibacteria group bacterium]|nr:hypothetical protein [Patescibacteria group bacterium]